MLYRLVLKPFRGSFVFKLHIYLLLHFQQQISRRCQTEQLRGRLLKNVSTSYKYLSLND